LETYVSATGIKRTVYKLLADYLQDSSLRDVSYNNLTSEMIGEAAKKGDKIAKEAFDYTGKLLGMTLADSVAYTSPQAIFLFGGLAKSDDLILKPTIKHFEQNLLKIYKGKIKILLSELKEHNAAVMGSAALAWKELDKLK
jgi:glucokinase